MGANEDLIAEAREYADAIQGGENENWMRLVACVDRLADAVEWHKLQEAGLRDDIPNIEAERDAALAVIERVRVARANHPACDVHPDADVISCGWKRAVLDIDAALSTSGTEALEARDAEKWDEGYWQGINGHTGPGNPYRDNGHTPRKTGEQSNG